MRILIAEDEDDIRRLLGSYFGSRGHAVIPASNGEEALEQFASSAPDLILLDVRMPRLDGWEVLRQIRESASSVPVLMLTALDSTADAVKGLGLGADDYLRKPINLGELEARVQAVLRRLAPRPTEIWEVGGCRIDKRSKKVYLNGEALDLSPKEYALFLVLAREPERVFSNEELVAELWPGSTRADSTDVKQFIYLLRSKLKDAQSSACQIKTVKGFGYKLVIGLATS